MRYVAIEIAPPQAYTQPIQYQQPYVYGQNNVQYPQQPMYQQSMHAQNAYAQQMSVQQPHPVILQQQSTESTLYQNENVNTKTVPSKKGGGIEIIRQGYMMKKGDLIKSWKKRYFVLKTNKSLDYYESSDAVMIKGACSLSKAKGVKKKSGHSFEIDTPKRRWCFACKDDQIRDQWVQAIQSVIEK